MIWLFLLNALQADWGPLRHIRVIKERSTGVSRGFAFVDFPDVVSFLFFPIRAFTGPFTSGDLFELLVFQKIQKSEIGNNFHWSL